jgi:hypothetical protein
MNAFTNLSESFKETYVTLSEEMLVESRIDFLKEQNKTISTDHDTLATHHDAGAIIDHFAEHADPTKNKAHTQYIIGLYKNKSIRQEDAPSIKETLTNFEKYKGKLQADEKQLTPKAYPRISDVRAKLAPHLGLPTTNAEAREHLKNNLDIPGKHPLVYEDDTIKVYHNADKETAKKIYCSATDPKPGPHNTEWCTSRDTSNNKFDDYLKEHGGKYHVIHRKSDGAVFQLHPQSNQFMDKDDNPISADDFKSIAPSFHKAKKLHPEMMED